MQSRLLILRLLFVLFVCQFFCIPEAFGQYHGGASSELDQVQLLLSPQCNLPPFVPSLIYSGGNASEIDRAETLQNSSCGIPIFQASAIYTGGEEAGGAAARQIQTAACSLPLFVASDIYRGGIQDTNDKAMLISISLACNQGPPPPPPNIYTGGDWGGMDRGTIVQSTTCHIPPFVPSAIYTGGASSDTDRAVALQQGSCGVVNAVVSDIYKGGTDGDSHAAVLLQAGTCGISPAVASFIYAGGSSEGSYAGRIIQSPSCSIPLPVTQGIYGGGGEFSQYMRKTEQPCPSSPPLVLDPYRGGTHSLQESIGMLQSPSCGLPPVAISDIYKGGIDGVAQQVGFVQTVACALPVAIQSDIYKGGAWGDVNRAEFFLQPVCALPAFVASDIYKGGMQSATFMEDRIIACGSGTLGPVISDIYKGGALGDATALAFVQQGVCSVPLFVSSDIYRGGDLGAQANPLVTQTGSCALPVVVASDIYRGGNEGQAGLSSLSQFPSCSLPPFVNSAIYAGGIGIGYSQNSSQVSLVSSLSLPSAALAICAGETVQITASTSGSGTVNWAVNGLATYTGNPGILSGLSNQDSVVATLTSTLSCSQPGSSLQDTVVIQVNPGLGPNFILANPDVVCFGSGGVPVGGSAVTGSGTISYQWERSTNLQTWVGVGGQDTSIFSGSLTDTTWFRRLVNASTCAGPDTSNFVQIVVSPPPTALYSGNSQTGACHVAYVDGWVQFPSASNPSELLLSLRSIDTTFNPAETNVTGYLLSGNPIIDGFRVLNRSYDIVPQNNGSARIQFYFSQSDFDDLNTAEGGSLQLGDLLVTRFATGLTSNGQAIQPDTIISNFPFPGDYTLEITVPGFSSFYIHGPDPAPLPVVLKNFTGTCTEDGLTLNWETSTEINNRRFLIQQSAEASEWNTIGELSGMGTSSTGQSYTWRIPHDNLTGYYFRLLQEDFDGTMESFPALAKVCDAPIARFGVRPNPAKGFTWVEFDAQKSGSGELALMAIDGRTVWSKEMHWVAGGLKEGLDLQGLSSGMYMLVLRTKTGTVYSTRIILN